MRLERVLDNLNTIEKTPFSKIIYKLINSNPKNLVEINKCLSSSSDVNLKNLESSVLARVYSLVEDEYYKTLCETIDSRVSQLDILIDILIRDGNCKISRIWLDTLYRQEVKKIKKRVNEWKTDFGNKDVSETEGRDRDFLIYRNCLETAYFNDEKNNLEAKITSDEKSILNKLSETLDLSQEEVKFLNYSILPLKKLDIDEVIEMLRQAGVILYSRRDLEIYIPDEIVRLLRKYRSKEVADKYLRRILRQLKDSEVNNICKVHDIDRKLKRREKIKSIIDQGVGIRNVLKNDIHKLGVSLSDRKMRLNKIAVKGLGFKHLKGVTIDQKIESFIGYFNDIERDEKVGISIDGYKKLLDDLDNHMKNSHKLIRDSFELQDETAVECHELLEFNLKPRDILEIYENDELVKFCQNTSVSSRGNIVLNVLSNYQDVGSIELESYADIASRNNLALKENGVLVKDSELGVKFEKLTKRILVDLGFNVDESLRKEINTSKDKADILIRINDTDVILVECKTHKSEDYAKFSSVSRQLIAYKKRIELNGYKVLKSILIAPSFSQEFINNVDVNFELNLSVISATDLLAIHTLFKEQTKYKELPYMLFMRDVVIQKDRIMRAIS